jgi:hypothetical protein
MKTCVESCMLNLTIDKKKFDRRLDRWFSLVFVIVLGLKLMMGFARKSLLSFFVGTQCPSPELLFGVWTVRCLACSVARFGRETSTKLIVRRKTPKRETKFDM